MFSSSDTIVAIATPPGRGGIGVVRLSGTMACGIARVLSGRSEPFEPRHATLTRIRHAATGLPIDETIVTCFPAPASYTGEDIVEISAHGSPVILRQIVEAAIGAGARLAEPGEFTLRAFLNGRIDLPRAEAVADLVDAVTPAQARAAFDQLQGTLTDEIAALDARLFDLAARLEASVDFPDEGYHFVESSAVATEIADVAASVRALLATARRGRILREGVQVAIVGRANVGKSSLFNALVGSSRAIVAETPGTTRDLVTETLDICGVRVLLIDTAGMRDAGDPAEREGVARAARSRDVADLLLVVIDGATPLQSEDILLVDQTKNKKRLIISNKVDVASLHGQIADVMVSALSGVGLDALRTRMLAALDYEPATDAPAVTNIRHTVLLERAAESLDRAVATADGGAPEELVLADLQSARSAFEEVTGRRTPDDLLAHVFARFCVGK